MGRTGGKRGEAQRTHGGVVLLMGLVATRFVNEVAPALVQVVCVGAAVGTDWLLRWREAVSRYASTGGVRG